MVVLSLFDGIGCGMLALQRAGINVEAYYASEIEPSAIKIALHNHPNITQIGDIRAISYDYSSGILFANGAEYKTGKIDLVIGGSPCTDFSSIGYSHGMKIGSMEISSLKQYLSLKQNNVQFEGQSYLFWEYIRLLNEIKPKYYLLENVVMAKKWQKLIDDTLQTIPIKINSSLLSAQNRPRLYWTNIKNVEIPNDMHITLNDILSEKAPKNDVSDCLTVTKSFPRLVKKYGYVPERFNSYNASLITEKACALSRGSMVTSSCATLLFVKKADGEHIVKNRLLNGKYPTKLKAGRYNLRRLSINEMERLQTLPDGYTDIDGISNQARSAAIGNGWTVDVIAHILSYIER